MICDELMTRDVETIAPSDTVQAAACLMRDENIGLLPVCQSSGAVLGVITDRDIAVSIVADNLSADTEVCEVMSDYAVSCRPHDDIDAAAQIMAENHVSRILCIDAAGRLAGVLSLSDIAQLGERNAVEALARIGERATRI
jgi:CBS domain-containing protein